MPTRREFLAQSGAMVATSLLPNLASSEPLVSTVDLKFLRDLAKATIASATKTESAPGIGFPAITPGGAYPSLWIRDFSMSAGCGLISPEVIHQHLQSIAAAQAGGIDRVFGSRAKIPAHSIPDHINFQGGPVFFPGTYSAGSDQGGEPYGILPPIDDQFEFIHIAYSLWKATGQIDFLLQPVNGVRMWDRLKWSFLVVRANPDTGLVGTTPEQRAVGFGFCDGIYLTGDLLFPSLLRYRACGELAELAVAINEDFRQFSLPAEQRTIQRHVARVFLSQGWLRAATSVGQQPDVWGSAFALYLGVVHGKDRSVLLDTIAQAARSGTITYKGAVRHVPTDHDFSANTAWERTAGESLNRYQNGAYWHVPTGWLAQVLWKVDKPAARELVKAMIAHLREEDFRIGEGYGAPWECLHQDRNYRQNPIYMASVTLPLECLSRRQPA